MAVRTFVFDLDGVVYRGEQPLPGAVDTIQNLRQLGHQVRFFTNNSTQTRTTYANKLSRMGIDVDEAHIMTSSYATALYLTEIGAGGGSVLIVGEEGIEVEMKAIGMRIVKKPERPTSNVELPTSNEKHELRHVDFVVVGLDRSFCYETLMRAQQAIFHGAKFIATNRDSTFPLEEGLIAPGGGTIVSALETATGVRPMVIGKPETYAMQEILKLTKSTPADSVIIGDRLDTDILAGNRLGMTTVLVLTGVTSEKDLETAPLDMEPDIVIHSLPELMERV